MAMKAIRIHEPTGVSGMVYEEAPDPTPMICEVLVKVVACGITHNELGYPIWTCRAGHPRASIIPGAEVSGVIAALGSGTAGVAVDDEVFGLTDQLRDGTAAEYVAVEARNLAPKPRTVDHVHAAALPRAGLTAWQALFNHGQLAKGQTVVIHGAAGAVGSTAVQLARWAGAETAAVPNPASSVAPRPRGSSSSASGLPHVSATMRSRTCSSNPDRTAELSSARASSLRKPATSTSGKCRS
jgi:NADPH:quinone reductase-like Zn-dependent oxidoreductase